MQSHLGGPQGASWPHLEHSCLQFLSPFSKAVGDRDLAELRWANSHVEGRDAWWDVDSPPRGSVQVPCCSSWLTDAHFPPASWFQSQSWLETFKSITPGTHSFQKEDYH